MKVTERDIALKLWINGFGFVLVSQIAKWMGVDFSTAARRVRALVEAGLVRRVKSSILSATPIIVTPKGAQVAGDSLPPLSGIRHGEFRHDSVLVDVARGLTAKFPDSHFEPVRRIRHSGALAEARHLPDGYLHRGPDRYIVELELTVKSRKRLETIMAEHTADLGAKEVWYVTDSDMVAGAIRRVSADLDHVKIVRLQKTPPKAPATDATKENA